MEVMESCFLVGMPVVLDRFLTVEKRDELENRSHCLFVCLFFLREIYAEYSYVNESNQLQQVYTCVFAWKQDA